MPESKQLAEKASDTGPSPEHPFKSPNFRSSLGFAVRGIMLVLRQERNFQSHCLIAVLVTVAGVVLRVSPTEWILLVLCMTLMMGVEMLNTAIEYMVDRLVDGQYSEPARLVKDVSAGACLITAIGVAIAGALIFMPHLLNR